MNFVLIIQAEEHKDKRIREICSFVLVSKIFKISSYDKVSHWKGIQAVVPQLLPAQADFIFPCHDYDN